MRPRPRGRGSAGASPSRGRYGSAALRHPNYRPDREVGVPRGSGVFDHGWRGGHGWRQRFWDRRGDLAVRLRGASPSRGRYGSAALRPPPELQARPGGRRSQGGAESSTTDDMEDTDGKCRPPIPSALSFQLSSLIPSRPPSAFSFHPSALRLQGRRPWMVWQMQPNSSSLRPG